MIYRVFLMDKIKEKKLPVPTEYEECLVLVEYLVRKGIRFTHINNEMWTSSWGQKMKSKNMHTDSGVPDYMLVIEKEQCKLGYAIMLFIEMKRANLKESAVKPTQRAWINAINRVENVEAVVKFGASEAIDYVSKFLF